jgi:hypothetical protein
MNPVENPDGAECITVFRLTRLGYEALTECLED